MDAETGFCPAHDPDGRERLREVASKGGQATARRFRAEDRLEDSDLPPLESPQDAERWCEIVGRAVATGRLSHNQGKAVIRAIRESLRSHEAGEVADQVEELQDKVAKLKGGDLKALK